MQKNYKLKSIRSIILNRSLITLVTILFIRIGTFIPIPGVNLIDLALFIEKDSVTTNIAYLFSLQSSISYSTNTATDFTTKYFKL